MPPALARHATAIASAAAGLAWFLVQVGPAVLDPTRVGWLMRNDWAANYLGWAFFRLAPLRLPLGTIPGYPFPVGSALAFGDSLPLVGVLLRPLSALLPVDFQYVGLWLGLCFALQGFAGAKLVKLVTDDRLLQALGGTLFALAPPLLHRVVGPNTGHASLCAHWLILSFLWLALAPVEPDRVRPRLAVAIALVLVSSGLHPYHVIMGVALTGALLLRLWTVERIVGWRTAAIGSATVVGAAALGLLAFGYILPGVVMDSGGFGFFSADALALVNPMGWSRIWSGLRIGNGQYEGFGYLGGGVLLLGAAAGASAVWARGCLAGLRWRPALPALGVSFLLAVFSLSDRITVAGEPVVRIAAYALVPALGRAFRSSGRFLWPLHYLAVLTAIAALAKAWSSRPRLAAIGLGLAIALQVADVRPPVPMATDDGEWARPGSDAWAAARGRYRHVALVPPFLVTGNGPAAVECPPAFPEAYVAAADIAYRLSATFNSAYVSRIDPARAAAACAEMSRDLESGRLDPDTIYIVHPAYWLLFTASSATCGALDGLPVCVDRRRRDAFGEALRLTRLE